MKPIGLLDEIEESVYRANFSSHIRFFICEFALDGFQIKTERQIIHCI